MYVLNYTKDYMLWSLQIDIGSNLFIMNTFHVRLQKANSLLHLLHDVVNFMPE